MDVTSLTHNANLLLSIGNRRTVDIRGKWINWLDQNGWSTIDCSFREVGRRWECRTGPLTVSVPPRADGICHVVSSNRWDVFAKTRITDPDFSLHIQAVGTSLADAVLESPTSIMFPGAYPFGDLIYRMNFGRAPRLEKLVRINTKPAGNDDLRISFTINHNAANVVSFDRVLSVKEKDDHFQIGIDLKNKLNNNSRVQDIMVENFRQRMMHIDMWNGNNKTLQGVSLGFAAAQATGRRGVGIKPAFAWDSSPEPKRIPIVLEIERLPNGSMTLTKVVPRTFLDAATYPLMTDTTTTFYPNANVETTSVDGYVERINVTPESWSTLRSGAGTSRSDSLPENLVAFSATNMNSLWRSLRRTISLFDTSAIGSTSTITSAALSHYVSSDTIELVSGDPTISIYGSTPASNTSLANSDYGQTGTTAFATAIAMSAISGDAYSGWPLNETGLGNISKIGITKTSLKNSNWDALNIAPTWSSSALCNFVIFSADEAGSAQDPKLVVDYTVDGGGDVSILMSPMCPPSKSCF